MAKFHGREVAVFYHGYNISIDLNSVEIPWDYETAEATGFTEASKHYLLGNVDSPLTHEGFLDHGTSPLRTHPIATADLGNSNARAFTVVLGTAQGAIGAAGSAVVLEDYNVLGDVGAALVTRTAYHVEDSIGMDAVNLVEKTSADTVTGVGAGWDSAVVGGSNAGIRAYLHVMGVTNGPGTVILQHAAASAGAWTDKITFTAASALTGEGKSASGTVSRWLRRNITAGSAEVVITHRRL